MVFRPQPSTSTFITAREQSALANPQGYFLSLPPLLAAYSHSASVGRRPPIQRQNALAWAQVTQTIGWPSPTVAPAPFIFFFFENQREHLVGEQRWDLTQAAYWDRVTGAFII